MSLIGARYMPSRADLFQNTPSEALPAPEKLRLAFFMSAEKHNTVRVEDDGIAFRDAFYEPVRQDEDARECMQKAAALYKLYKIKVPIIRAILKGKEYVFIKFAGRDFEPIKKKKARSFRGKTHPQNQKADLQRISSRIPAKLERMEQLILDTFGSELGQDAYFKTSVLLQGKDSAVTPSSTGQNTAQSPGTSDPAAQDREKASGMLSSPSDGTPANDSHSGQRSGEETQATFPGEPSLTLPPDDANSQAQPQQPKVSEAVRRLREKFYEDNEETL
jgi:hypothetical protein